MILISNMTKIIFKKVKCIFHVFLHKFYFDIKITSIYRKIKL